MSFLKDLIKSVLSSEAKKTVESGVNKYVTEPWKRPDSAPQQAPAAARPVYGQQPVSGESWGPVMPAEPNQFNSGKTYVEYFYDLFRLNFPGYQVICQDLPRRVPATAITFLLAGRQALVVELMSEHSDSNQLRRQCQATRVPYLRFYYDHYGWWNTETYVINRVGAAIRR